MIRYHVGNLFEAPVGSVLVHAASTRGVWGAGIAYAFRRRFPRAYGDYRRACGMNSKTGRLCLTRDDYSPDRPYWVATLITSRGYGDGVDSPEIICQNTTIALATLVSQLPSLESNPPTIHMPKINSGLFRVPWVRTEEILNRDYSEITWNVWNLT